MSDKNKKVNRGVNFTTEESLLLLNEVYKERYVIENKTINKLASLEKEKAWNRILKHFNSKNCQSRSLSQLRSRYDNLKTRARKIITGTPDAACNRFDPLTESVLKVINIHIDEGFVNTADCDSNSVDFAPIDTSVIKFESSDESIFVDCNNLPQTEELAERSNSEKFEFTSLLESTPSKSIQQPVEKNWNSYNPRRFKKPIFRKFRPSIAYTESLIKLEYYKKKKLFFEEEIKAKQLSLIREEKEHQLKCKLLELQIKIKEAELKEKIKNTQ